MKRQDGREEEDLRHVERLAAAPLVVLPHDEVGDEGGQGDGRRDYRQVLPADLPDPAPGKDTRPAPHLRHGRQGRHVGGKAEGHAALGMAQHEDDEGEDQAQVHQGSVAAAVLGGSFAVLHLVKPHEAVVLANHVPVGPDADGQGEDLKRHHVVRHPGPVEPEAEQKHGRAGEDPEEAEQKKAATRPELGLVEVGPQVGTEEVGRIEEGDEEQVDEQHVPSEARVHEEDHVPGERAADECGKINLFSDNPFDAQAGGGVVHWFEQRAENPMISVPKSIGA